METKREIAKENITKLINENLDRYNELSHTCHNYLWLEVYPDGTANETEEVSATTTHWVDYPNKSVANVLSIAQGFYCDCDACTSYKQAFDDEITDDDFKSKWGYDKCDVDKDFAQHLKDCEAYNYDMVENACDNIDDLYLGYFDDETHTIEDVELTKHGYNHDCLTYVADGKYCQFDGEFYVDKEGFLHHTHIFDDGIEKEIIVKY